MDFQKQVTAYRLIENLIDGGRSMSALPVPYERAKGIITMREPATEQDLALLEHAGGLAMTAVVEK